MEHLNRDATARPSKRFMVPRVREVEMVNQMTGPDSEVYHKSTVDTEIVSPAATPRTDLSPLLNLPDEVLMQVAREMSPEQLIDFRTLCRRIRDVTEESFSATYFTEVNHALEIKSLNNLRDIAEHEWRDESGKLKGYRHQLQKVSFDLYTELDKIEDKRRALIIAFEKLAKIGRPLHIGMHNCRPQSSKKTAANHSVFVFHEVATAISASGLELKGLCIEHIGETLNAWYSRSPFNRIFEKLACKRVNRKLRFKEIDIDACRDRPVSVHHPRTLHVIYKHREESLTIRGLHKPGYEQNAEQLLGNLTFPRMFGTRVVKYEHCTFTCEALADTLHSDHQSGRHLYFTNVSLYSYERLVDYRIMLSEIESKQLDLLALEDFDILVVDTIDNNDGGKYQLQKKLLIMEGRDAIKVGIERLLDMSRTWDI